jgi:predicted kinase
VYQNYTKEDKMRKLVILRGSAGAGKSTWIKNNGLEQFTLSADNVRLLFQSPVYDKDGNLVISMKNDKRVWDFVMQLLEERMKRGEFTVIDATHSHAKDASRYKALVEKYRYHICCVDFTDVNIDVCKVQNTQRPHYKIVPESVIDRMYTRFSTPIPNWVKTIKPHEFDAHSTLEPLDFSQYEMIHHIGDVHGCNTVLQEYLKDGLNPNHMYIFCGDFVDRGIENAEVINFLLSIMNRENVILLEGNHEIHLWRYANDEKGLSKEFNERTIPQLEDGYVSKKSLRTLYRKLRQLAYYTYGEKKVIVTHGGLPLIPDDLMYLSSDQIIKGVGRYEDEIDSTFLELTDDNSYQIHGHRNIQCFATQVNERTFNLEGKVEFGGDLRVVTLSAEGFKTIDIENEVYNDNRFNKRMNVKPVEVDNVTFLKELTECEFIKRKPQGNGIYSFNFKRDVFYDRLWDKAPLTIKARGLFINENTTEIVARSYPKFFSVGERLDTQGENLKLTLKFPIDVYVKENGFLGILGYDSERDELIVASKSTTQGDYAGYFKDMLYKIINTDKKERELKDFLKEENCSMVFEVVDMDNDPHIIEYRSNRLILLDIIRRTPNFEKYSYEELKTMSMHFGFKYKDKYTTLNNWQSFLGWQKDVENLDFQYGGRYIEGFVLECVDGFMTKVKLNYYNTWKHMRTIKDKYVNNPKSVIKEMYKDENVKEFVDFLKICDDEILKSDIINVRNEFFKHRMKSKLREDKAVNE